MEIPNQTVSDNKSMAININDFETFIKEVFKKELDKNINKILIENKEIFLSKIYDNVSHHIDNKHTFNYRKINILKEAFEKYNKEFIKTYTNICDDLNDTLIIFKEKQDEFLLLNEYKKHCKDSNNYATHKCNGRIIKIIGKRDKIQYLICESCKICYLPENIELSCNCGSNFYSRLLNEGEDGNIMYATWDKYHCPSLTNEKMKCIKCKDYIHFNIIDNLLICKSCNFKIEPNQIIWSCIYCKSAFRSKAKFYNEFEHKDLKDKLYKIVEDKICARPEGLPCECKLDINKTVFFHKKECQGLLYKGKYNGMTVVVCSDCKTTNYLDYYLWTCPQCFKRFKSVINGKKDDNKSPEIKSQSKSFNVETNAKKENENTLLNKKSSNSRDNSPVKSGSKIKLTNKKFIENLDNLNNEEDDIKVRKFDINITECDQNSTKELIEINRNDSRAASTKHDNPDDLLYKIRQIQNEKSEIKKNELIKPESINNFNTVPANPSTPNIIRKKTIETKIDMNPSFMNDMYNSGNERKKSVVTSTMDSEPVIIRKINLESGANKDHREPISKKSKDISGKEIDDILDHSRYSVSPIKIKTILNNSDQLNEIVYNSCRKDNQFKNRIKGESNKSNQYKSTNNTLINYNLDKSEDVIKPHIEIKKIKISKGSDSSSTEFKSRSFESENSHYKNNSLKSEKKPKDNPNTDLYKQESPIIDYGVSLLEKKNIAEIPLKIPINKNTIIESEFKKKMRHHKKLSLIELPKLVLDENIEIRKNSEPGNRIIEINQIRKEISEFDSNQKENPNLEKKTNNNENIQKHEKKPSVITFDNDIQSIAKELETPKFIENVPIPISKDIVMKNRSKEIYKPAENLPTKHEIKNIPNKESDKLIIESNPARQSGKSVNKQESNDNISQNNKSSKITETRHSMLRESSNIIRFKEEDLRYSIAIEKKVPEIKLDDYDIVKQIGQGTFGKIYLVNDKFKNKFALKKIIAHDKFELSKMKKEFELLYQIDHPHVIKIHGMTNNKLDSTTYGLYFVTELANTDWDMDIKKRIKTKTYYTQQELVSILRQLISCLSWLQRNNISHRDIKPQNILIFDNNLFKLADFGDAKKNKDQRLNTLRGTELYMSPILFESLRNELVDIEHNLYKSDVFSLGYCVIYAATLGFSCLYEIREQWDMKMVERSVYRFFKDRYSDELIDCICGMIEINETLRFDFIQIEEFMDKYVK